MWPYWAALRPENQNEAGLVRGLVEDDLMDAISWAAHPVPCINLMGLNLVSDYVQPFDGWGPNIQTCPSCGAKYNPKAGVVMLNCLDCGANMLVAKN